MTIRRSYLLRQAEFAVMQINAKTLEQDARGAKVILLADNMILKIFRRRSNISGGLIYSNARRFCRNAERLQQLNVFTVNIIKLYHFENSTDTAVLYEPLEGETVRNLIFKHQITTTDCKKLGEFIARLHLIGLYFRSLHFGNIVKTDTGDFGLIDLSDMSIYWWNLQLHTRVRNFMRIKRYDSDIEALGAKPWSYLIQSYLKSAQLSKKQSVRLLNDLGIT